MDAMSDSPMKPDKRESKIAKCCKKKPSLKIPIAFLMAFTASILIASSTVLAWQITYQTTNESVLMLAQLAARGATSQIEETFMGYFSLAFECRKYIQMFYSKNPVPLLMPDLEKTTNFLFSLLTENIHGVSIATPLNNYISVGIVDGILTRWVCNNTRQMQEQRMDELGNVLGNKRRPYYYNPRSLLWYRTGANMTDREEMQFAEVQSHGNGVVSLELIFPLFRYVNTTTKVFQGTCKIWIYLEETQAWTAKSLSNARKLYKGSNDRSHLIFLFSRTGLSNGTLIEGPLIAASHGTIMYTLPNVSKPFLRLANESDDPIIASATDLLLQRFGSFEKISESPMLTLNTKEGPYFILSTPMGNASIGLDLVAVQVTERRVIYEKIDERYRQVIVIVVCCLVGSIILLIIVTHIITRSLNTLSVMMGARVANMEVSDLPKMNSIIKEISMMQRSFVVMCEALSAYKAYLPGSIFAQTSISDEALDPSSPIKPNTNSTAPAKVNNNSIISESNSILDVVSEKIAKSSRSSRHEGNAVNTNLLVSLNRKPVTLLMIAIPRFAMHTTTDFPSVVELGKCTEELVSKIQHELKEEKLAVISSFGAGWVLINYRCGGTIGDIRACRLALKLKSSLNTNQANEINYSFSICSSNALIGNVGSQTYRTTALYGPVVMKVKALCSLCSAWGVRILISESVHHNTSQQLENRQIDRIQWLCQTSPEGVYELIGERSMGEDEWMYQLESAEKVSIFKYFNVGFKSFINGDYTSAKHSFLTSLNDFPNDTVASCLLSMCERAAETKKEIEPASPKKGLMVEEEPNSVDKSVVSIIQPQDRKTTQVIVKGFRDCYVPPSIPYIRRQLPIFDYADPSWSHNRFSVPY